MGAVGGLFGTAGGAGGTGFSNPNQASIQNPVTMGQINQSYGQVQGGLAQQEALVNALNQQNGIGNQSAILAQQQGLANALAGNNGAGFQQNALAQQNALNNQLAAQNAVGNQQGALQAQRALANQQAATAGMYQDIAAGRGPNPAQAMLANQTGQNVANQAAMMASQRGASANAGLIARQAAQQGAATQQQAVGQGAALQAQQQMNALSGLSAQQQAIGNTNQSVAGIAGQQLGAQQQGIGAQGALAGQAIGQQQAQQQAMQQAAANQVANQIAASNQQNQALQNQQGTLIGGMNAVNQANVASQGSVNAANAGMASTQMQGQHGIVGGIMSGAASVLGLAEGGDVAMPAAPAVAGPMSNFGKFLSGFGKGMSPDAAQQGVVSTMGYGNPNDKALNQGMSNLMTAVGSRMRGPKTTGPVASGGDESLAGPAMPMSMSGMARGGLAASGGNVKAKSPAQKAVKGGNSYANDKIPALLSEGEIVIPRAVTMGKDPVRGAANFVAQVLSKRGA